MTFLLITVLIDTIGFGIIIPAFPSLIVSLTGEPLGRAATYSGWLMFLFSVMQFFCAPIIGNLSDRFGRRPVLILSLLAFGLDFFVSGLAPTLTWLFVSRAVAGITGATYPTANAYITDISPPEQRAQNFGMMGAAFGVGFILGPVLGGLIGMIGPRAPFFAAGGLAVLNALYGYFVLPESLKPENRRSFSLKRANPLGALRQLQAFPMIFAFFGVLLFMQLAHDSLPSVYTFYSMLKFGWTEQEVGYSLGAVGFLMAVVQGGLMGRIMPKLGERRAAYVGLALSALGFFGFALAPTSAFVYVAMVPMALGGIGMPALQAIMTKMVPANQQGELQGSIASLNSIMQVLAPLVMTQLFGFFTVKDAPVYFPGAPFTLAGLSVLCGLAVLWLKTSDSTPTCTR